MSDELHQDTKRLDWLLEHGYWKLTREKIDESMLQTHQCQPLHTSERELEIPDKSGGTLGPLRGWWKASEAKTVEGAVTEIPDLS
jgi:hypothetical protein